MRVQQSRFCSRCRFILSKLKQLFSFLRDTLIIRWYRRFQRIRTIRQLDADPPRKKSLIFTSYLHGLLETQSIASIETPCKINENKVYVGYANKKIHFIMVHRRSNVAITIETAKNYLLMLCSSAFCVFLIKLGSKLQLQEFRLIGVHSFAYAELML